MSSVAEIRLDHPTLYEPQSPFLVPRVLSIELSDIPSQSIRRATMKEIDPISLFPPEREPQPRPPGPFEMEPSPEHLCDAVCVAAVAAYVQYAHPVVLYFCIVSIVCSVAMAFLVFRGRFLATSVASVQVGYAGFVFHVLYWVFLGIAVCWPQSGSLTSPLPSQSEMLCAVCLVVWTTVPLHCSIPLVVGLTLLVGFTGVGWGGPVCVWISSFMILIHYHFKRHKGDSTVVPISPTGRFSLRRQTNSSESSMSSNAGNSNAFTSVRSSRESSFESILNLSKQTYSGRSHSMFTTGQHVVLLRSMSDEFRGPASNLVNLSRVIRQTIPAEYGGPGSDLECLEGTANRLLVLLNSYLDLIKLSGEGIALENQVVDVQHMIRIALTPSLSSPCLRKIPVWIYIDPTTPQYLLGDEVRISQVCSNLFDFVLSRITQGHIEIVISCDKVDIEKTNVVIKVRCYDVSFDTKELSAIQNSCGGGGSTMSSSLLIRIAKTLLTEVFQGTIRFEDSRTPLNSKDSFELSWSFPTPHEKYAVQAKVPTTVSLQDAARLRVEGKMIKIYIHPNVDDNIQHAVRGYLSSLCEFVPEEECEVAFVPEPLPQSTKPQLILQYVTQAQTHHQYSDSEHIYLYMPFYYCDLLDSLSMMIGSRCAHQRRESILPKAMKILVAEDNAIAAKVLKRVIENAEGAHCVIVENGLRCLEEYTSNPGMYSVIFMDVCMPVMDGIEAIRRIRSYEQQNHITTGIQIFTVTANALSTDEDECIRAGANGCFTKPISRDTVLAVLKICCQTIL